MYPCRICLTNHHLSNREKKHFAFGYPSGYYLYPKLKILCTDLHNLIGYPPVLRSIAFIALLMLLTVPASGMKSQLYQLSNGTLSTSAALLRSGDYSGASQLARALPAGGARDFISGVAAFKNKEWDQASTDLQSAARSFELLADYALYFQAQALTAQKKDDVALTALLALTRLYPDSPLKRKALFQIGDIQYTRHSHAAAVAAYQKFIETYPTGSDALTAQYRIALCREALGEPAAAVKILRNLWLTSPASPVAELAEKELNRLSSSGQQPAPYSADELFRRAVTLLDLKKLPQAVTALKEVPREGQSKNFIERLDLRTGQALFRSKKYREAESLYIKTASKTKDPAHAAEATYWLARCLDRNDRHEESVLTFHQVAERWPKANESDNSLMEAALIRKSEQRWSDALAMIQRLLAEYPETSLKKQAWWEGGWSAYKAGEMQTARDFFTRLAGSDTGRDRALYWLARVNAATGDVKGAQETYATLVRSFPMSFYSLATPPGESSTGAVIDSQSLPRIDRETVETLPLPANYERVRALITFGLVEEAKKELSSAKAKSSDMSRLLGVARLYLEMDDVNGAYNLVRREPARLHAREQNQMLALQYPLPFRESAVRHADSYRLALPLIFAIIRTESSFAPAAVSPVGAVGLMQLMPSTAAMIEGAGKKSFSSDRLKQPELNINYGAKHMKDLISQYNNNLIPVIASYNAGSGSVNRWLQRFGNLPDIEFIEQIPYTETRDYVKQVIASTAIYARLYDLPLSGVTLPLPPKPI